LSDELGKGVLGEHRPVPQLMKYYALESLILGPFFLFWLLPRSFRYRSLHYRFDEEGVSMSWGVLFHRQVSLTYGRIQDIHLQSNLFERRLGLAKVKIQFVDGSATAEMTIEGLENYDAVRAGSSDRWRPRRQPVTRAPGWLRRSTRSPTRSVACAGISRRGTGRAGGRSRNERTPAEVPCHQ
jgi:putative membrane protein